jgi:hypothetical protein
MARWVKSRCKTKSVTVQPEILHFNRHYVFSGQMTLMALLVKRVELLPLSLYCYCGCHCRYNSQSLAKKST